MGPGTLPAPALERSSFICGDFGAVFVTVLGLGRFGPYPAHLGPHRSKVGGKRVIRTKGVPQTLLLVSLDTRWPAAATLPLSTPSPPG